LAKKTASWPAGTQILDFFLKIFSIPAANISLYTTELTNKLRHGGYESMVLPVDVVHELKEDIQAQLDENLIDPGFFQKELSTNLDFDYKSVLRDTKSVIIVACFQPPTRVRFGDALLTIPPTYIYRDIWEESFRSLSAILKPGGYRAKRAKLPLKLLASRAGLGQYGRNNLCYIDGMGSFNRIGAFYSDMPPGHFQWEPPRVMEKCRNCLCCQKACPTKAIGQARFLLNAERCLTFFNENIEPFPDWIKPAWHNAVIGCMRCQAACPVNHTLPFKTLESKIEFSEKELSVILEGSGLESLPGEIKGKLHELCLDDDYAVLARNISLLISNQA
jgi:epoxyqueuosine reductase